MLALVFRLSDCSMISQRLVYLSLSANLLLAGVIGGMVISRATSSGPAATSQAQASIAESPATLVSARPISQTRPAQAPPIAQAPASARNTAHASAPGNSSGSGTWQYAQSSSPATRGASPSGNSRFSSGSSTAQSQLSASYSNDSGSSVGATGASIPASYGNTGGSASGQVSSGGAPVNPVALDASVSTGPARTLTGTVQPDGSGNSFTDKGQKVAVADAAAADGSATGDLNVIVSPDPNATSTDSSSTGEKAAAFTHDQDLFRAKWGWGAYGEAQRAAWDVALGHTQ